MASSSHIGVIDNDYNAGKPKQLSMLVVLTEVSKLLLFLT